MKRSVERIESQHAFRPTPEPAEDLVRRRPPGGVERNQPDDVGAARRRVAGRRHQVDGGEGALDGGGDERVAQEDVLAVAEGGVEGGDAVEGVEGTEGGGAVERRQDDGPVEDGGDRQRAAERVAFDGRCGSVDGTPGGRGVARGVVVLEVLGARVAVVPVRVSGPHEVLLEAVDLRRLRHHPVVVDYDAARARRPVPRERPPPARAPAVALEVPPPELELLRGERDGGAPPVKRGDRLVEMSLVRDVRTEAGRRAHASVEGARRGGGADVDEAGVVGGGALEQGAEVGAPRAGGGERREGVGEEDDVGVAVQHRQAGVERRQDHGAAPVHLAFERRRAEPTAGGGIRRVVVAGRDVGGVVVTVHDAGEPAERVAAARRRRHEDKVMDGVTAQRRLVEVDGEVRVAAVDEREEDAAVRRRRAPQGCRKEAARVVSCCYRACVAVPGVEQQREWQQQQADGVATHAQQPWPPGQHPATRGGHVKDAVKVPTQLVIPDNRRTSPDGRVLCL